MHLFGDGLDRPVDLLAVGAHPDDVELAMGGTLAALVDKGYRVAILDLTNGEPTPYGSPEERLAEAHAAARMLGVSSRITLDLPNRYLMDTVEARTEVAQVIRALRPRILFAHYWEDAHPDHWAASRLAEAGRFYGKLTRTQMTGAPYLVPRVLYFYATHLRLIPQPALLFDISASFERKMQAVRAYHSQFFKGEDRSAVLDFVADSARHFGRLIQRAYAEPLTSREPLGLADFRDLTAG